MNIRPSFLTTAFLLFAALALPITTLAVQGGMYTTIHGVMLDSAPQASPTTGMAFGGCMAYLANPINTFGNSPNCPDYWVSFSCDGTYTTQSEAQMMYDQAQLAFINNYRVYVVVDDTKLENGYCTAIRLDLYK